LVAARKLGAQFGDGAGELLLHTLDMHEPLEDLFPQLGGRERY
jgi:hypothetical protein